MDWWPQGVTGAVAIASVVLGVANARYARRRDAQMDWQSAVDELEEKVHELEADYRVTKSQIALFWKIVEREIGNMLHSPHRAELDQLIEKSRHEPLSSEEVRQFADLLQRIADDEKNSRGEQAAALILKATVLASRAHHD